VTPNTTTSVVVLAGYVDPLAGTAVPFT